VIIFLASLLVLALFFTVSGTPWWARQYYYLVFAMAHRRSTTPASPAEQLAANLDTLLIEGDDYSMVDEARQGVGGMTIVQTPSPSVAVSALSGTGSIVGGQYWQYTPRVNVNPPRAVHHRP